MSVNRGKSSLAVDAKNADVAAVLRQIVIGSDVVVHNLRLGAMERIGLGHVEIMTKGSRLVYAVISGFGTSGPSRPGRDRSRLPGRVGDDGDFRGGG